MSASRITAALAVAAFLAAAGASAPASAAELALPAANKAAAAPAKEVAPAPAQKAETPRTAPARTAVVKPRPRPVRVAAWSPPRQYAAAYRPAFASVAFLALGVGY
jgi:hypothetical protein